VFSSSKGKIIEKWQRIVTKFNFFQIAALLYACEAPPSSTFRSTSANVENAYFHFRPSAGLGHALDSQIVEVLACVPVLFDHDGAHKTTNEKSFYST